MHSHQNKPPGADLELGPYADLLRQGLPTPAAIADNARRRRQRRRVLGSVAACVLVSAVVAADPPYSHSTLATTAQSQTSTLPDGSTVVLNRDSRVDVSLHLRSRRIDLQAGQALFDVAHSPVRSFVVQAGTARIEDIGTVFDVRRLADDSVNVTVVEGRVRVQDARASRELSTDEAATFDGAGWLPTRPVNAGYATAWRHGKMVFDTTPLAAVALELTRYGAPAIRFGDGAAAGIAISGQFDIARAAALLDLLPSIAPVRVHRDDNGTAVVSSR